MTKRIKYLVFVAAAVLGVGVFAVAATGSPPPWSNAKNAAAYADSGYVETETDANGVVTRIIARDGIPQDAQGNAHAASNDPLAHVVYDRSTAQTQALNPKVAKLVAQKQREINRLRRKMHLPVAGSRRPFDRSARAVTFNCCSYSGSQQLDWYESTHAALGTLLSRFHQQKYWAWTGGNHIIGVSIGTYFDITGWCVLCTTNSQYNGYGWYYAWNGNAQGGHYSLRQGKIGGGCATVGSWSGCVWLKYPWTRIWVNGNGAWAADDGGG